MSVTHIPIAEAQRDLDAVLARVRRGEQVAIDSGSESFVIQPAMHKGRSISESIRLAKEYEEATGNIGYMDEEFARDMEEIIAMRKPRKSLYDEE